MSKISASMMCAHLDSLTKTLKLFEEENIEYLHLDIMDGHFVPNLMLGTDYVSQMREMSRIPLDIHLMITEPEKKLQWFTPQPGDIFSVHYESTQHFAEALKMVRDAGAKAFAAINPPTPVSVLEPVIDLLDGVLVMTVNPGFAGQKAVPETIEKIAVTRAFLAAHGKADLPIEVDGNCSMTMSPLMRQKGADIFVTGTSGVFTKAMPMREAIHRYRECIE